MVTSWIECSWITPASPTKKELDQEDLARIRLIHQLRKDMGVNDEAIPIILELLDQICYLHNEMSKKWGQ